MPLIKQDCLFWYNSNNNKYQESLKMGSLLQALMRASENCKIWPLTHGVQNLDMVLKRSRTRWGSWAQKPFLITGNRLHSASMNFLEFQGADSNSCYSGKGGDAETRNISAALGQSSGALSRDTQSNIFELFCRTKPHQMEDVNYLMRHSSFQRRSQCPIITWLQAISGLKAWGPCTHPFRISNPTLDYKTPHNSPWVGMGHTVLRALLI